MLTRRRFLKYLGGLGIAAVLPGAILPSRVNAANAVLDIIGPKKIYTCIDVPSNMVYFIDTRKLRLMSPGREPEVISFSTPQGYNWVYDWRVKEKETQVSYWNGKEWKGLE